MMTPGEILRRIPGLELVEMGENRENSLCCGGGGGGIWMDVPMGERLSDVRLAQALDTGASVMAAFCPYCMLNFENSRLTLEDSDVIEMKDVTEIIEELI
jgi:Fe-S oxidoreductase